MCDRCVADGEGIAGGWAVKDMETDTKNLQTKTLTEQLRRKTEELCLNLYKFFIAKRPQDSTSVADNIVFSSCADINTRRDTNGRLIGRGWVKSNPAKMANFQFGVDKCLNLVPVHQGLSQLTHWLLYLRCQSRPHRKP